VRFNVATSGVRDVKGTTAAIQDKLTADKTIDGVLALNPVVGIAARDAVKAVKGTQKVATFDLSTDVLDAITAGDLMFAIDQQQYLQGYLPVVMLYLYKTNEHCRWRIAGPDSPASLTRATRRPSKISRRRARGRQPQT
jgi:simple sugar transport system substrate-binding protein